MLIRISAIHRLGFRLVDIDAIPIKVEHDMRFHGTGFLQIDRLPYYFGDCSFNADDF